MSERLVLADLLEQLVILSVGLRQLLERQEDVSGRRTAAETRLEARDGVSYVAGLGFLPFQLRLPVARTRRRSRRKSLRRFPPDKQKGSVFMFGDVEADAASASQQLREKNPAGNR